MAEDRLSGSMISTAWRLLHWMPLILWAWIGEGHKEWVDPAATRPSISVFVIASYRLRNQATAGPNNQTACQLQQSQICTKYSRKKINQPCSKSWSADLHGMSSRLDTHTHTHTLSLSSRPVVAFCHPSQTTKSVGANDHGGAAFGAW